REAWTPFRRGKTRARKRVEILEPSSLPLAGNLREAGPMRGHTRGQACTFPGRSSFRRPALPGALDAAPSPPRNGPLEKEHPGTFGRASADKPPTGSGRLRGSSRFLKGRCPGRTPSGPCTLGEREREPGAKEATRTGAKRLDRASGAFFGS